MSNYDSQKYEIFPRFHRQGLKVVLNFLSYNLEISQMSFYVIILINLIIMTLYYHLEFS